MPMVRQLCRRGGTRLGGCNRGRPPRVPVGTRGLVRRWHGCGRQGD
ncbi:hypothetical protein [Ornithinimicrobium kibberense]